MRWKGVVGFGVYPGRFWWQKQLMRGFEVGCGPHFFQNKCLIYGHLLEDGITMRNKIWQVIIIKVGK